MSFALISNSGTKPEKVKKTKQINTKIDEALHAKFKAWCAMRNYTIEDAIVKAINMMMEVKGI